jgi:hypothetical protein
VIADTLRKNPREFGSFSWRLLQFPLVDKAGTGIHLDTAGAPAVINTAVAAGKPGARLGVIAVHKEPVPGYGR